MTPTLVENYLEPEGHENSGTHYRDIYKGLFKAPTTGDYRFYISGDDSSQILVDSTTPFSSSVATYNPVKVAEVVGNTAYHDIKDASK